MTKSRRWLPHLLLLLLAGSVLPSCSPPTPEGAEEHGHEEEGEGIAESVELSEQAYSSLGLDIGTVERRSLAPLIEIPAELKPVPDRQATVGPRVAGRVLQVKVNVGDPVKRGSPLLVLESADVGEARADFVADQAKVEVALRAAKRARDHGAVDDGDRRILEHRVGAIDRRAEPRPARFQARTVRPTYRNIVGTRRSEPGC